MAAKVRGYAMDSGARQVTFLADAVTGHVEQFAQVLKQLRQECDQVMADATPLVFVSDRAIIGRASDGALLAVRFGKTTREQVATSVDGLTQVDARPAGTVMNFVPTGRRGYGYTYSYGYGGYGDSARAD